MNNKKDKKDARRVATIIKTINDSLISRCDSLPFYNREKLDTIFRSYIDSFYTMHKAFKILEAESNAFKVLLAYLADLINMYIYFNDFKDWQNFICVTDYYKKNLEALFIKYKSTKVSHN